MVPYGGRKNSKRQKLIFSATGKHTNVVNSNVSMNQSVNFRITLGEQWEIRFSLRYANKKIKIKHMT